MDPLFSADAFGKDFVRSSVKLLIWGVKDPEQRLSIARGQNDLFALLGTQLSEEELYQLAYYPDDEDPLIAIEEDPFATQDGPSRFTLDIPDPMSVTATPTSVWDGQASVPIGRDIETWREVRISAEARNQSTYVIGKPGTGKSTLLENIAIADMENGDGLCFLDPHGDSIERLLTCIPKHREQDVILWDPNDDEYPFGINPFFCPNPKHHGKVSDHFIAALASLKEFSEIFETAPQMKSRLEQLAIAFILNEGYTLVETLKFLRDVSFRQQFYPAVQTHNYPVYEFWVDFYDRLTPREQREEFHSSINKLERFQIDPTLWAIFRQPTNSIDFRWVMDTGKILIVKLSEQQIGEDNAAFIGAFIVWGIYQAALSRDDLPEKQRRPFHLIADEFQNFMSTALPKLMAQARKYNVDCTVAHQARGQIDAKSRETTLMTANKVIFAITGHDARELSWEFDTTPPPPEATGQRPIQTLSQEPWSELVRTGHTNPAVNDLLLRLKDMFYNRNLSEFSDEEGDPPFWFRPEDRHWYRTEGYRDEIGRRVDPLPKLVKRVPVIPMELPIESFGKWANPYLLAREQGQENMEFLKIMVEKFGTVRFPTGNLVDRFAWEHEHQELYSAAQQAIRELFEKTMRALGDLLARGENHIKTESGQYEPVPGPQRSHDDRANEIANLLANLPRYTARCKLNQDGRPTEYTITTLKPTDACPDDVASAAAIRQRSRRQFGRDRPTVQQDITERISRTLRQRPPTPDDAHRPSKPPSPPQRGADDDDQPIQPRRKTP